MRGFSIFLPVYLLSFFSVKAQNETWQATIAAVPTDGFYRVHLPAQVLAKANNQFNRIRIFEVSTEIPYLIKTEAAIISESSIQNLPILERKERDSSGFIILENPRAVRLSSLIIEIKRVWISKKLKISGSDDGKNWFAVRSEFLLDAFQIPENGNTTTARYGIDIPLTDYKFYKIESNNRDDLSMNVLSVGYASHTEKKGRLLALPNPVMSKEKTVEPSESLFKFTFNEPYILNQLVFKIERPRFFQRNARLYFVDPRLKSAFGKGKNRLESAPFKFFTLSSNDSLSTISLEDNSVSTFFVLIENEDNPPLEIKSVQAFQNKNFIYIYLEKGRTYSFKIGPPDLLSPVYDLSAFENKMGENIPELKIGGLHKGADAPLHTTNTFFKTKYWIWLGLICVAVLLVYVSLQMMKELKNGQNPG